MRASRCTELTPRQPGIWLTSMFRSGQSRFASPSGNLERLCCGPGPTSPLDGTRASQCLAVSSRTFQWQYRQVHQVAGWTDRWTRMSYQASRCQLSSGPPAWPRGRSLASVFSKSTVARGSQLLMFLSLSLVLPACADQDPPSDEAAEPQAIVDAWAAVVCTDPDAKLRYPDLSDPMGEFEDSIVLAAGCTDPDAASNPFGYVEVHATSSGVRTKLAGADCTLDVYRVTGPTWYSNTGRADVATLLQDAGGVLSSC